MEYFIEFLLELVFDIGFDISKNKKTPKWIRYLSIMLFVLFFLSVIGLILFVGIASLKENSLAGILLILVGLFMLVMGIVKFKKAYLDFAQKKQDGL